LPPTRGGIETKEAVAVEAGSRGGGGPGGGDMTPAAAAALLFFVAAALLVVAVAVRWTALSWWVVVTAAGRGCAGGAAAGCPSGLVMGSGGACSGWKTVAMRGGRCLNIVVVAGVVDAGVVDATVAVVAAAGVVDAGVVDVVDVAAAPPAANATTTPADVVASVVVVAIAFRIATWCGNITNSPQDGSILFFTAVIQYRCTVESEKPSCSRAALIPNFFILLLSLIIRSFVNRNWTILLALSREIGGGAMACIVLVFLFCFVRDYYGLFLLLSCHCRRSATKKYSIKIEY
jgi:hypothetical protein